MKKYNKHLVKMINSLLDCEHPKKVTKAFGNRYDGFFEIELESYESEFRYDVTVTQFRIKNPKNHIIQGFKWIEDSEYHKRAMDSWESLEKLFKKEYNLDIYRMPKRVKLKKMYQEIEYVDDEDIVIQLEKSRNS